MQRSLVQVKHTSIFIKRYFISDKKRNNFYPLPKPRIFVGDVTPIISRTAGCHQIFLKYD